ncbi:MAG: DNA polymerase III subunit alpha [Lachnospiraceae bacterium]|nr:DNA polymerase III subunit alpha [Lachnospiraceae bacterium]
MAFAHLHVHTEYSLLDGSNKIKEYVERVKELGMTSAAITDHGAMYGCIDFYKAAREAGIKPILGCEVYVAPGSRFDKEAGIVGEERYYHLVLLAENDLGYSNLMKIVSAGFVDGFYYRPRVDKEILRRYHEGIIALSACLAGEVARDLVRMDYPKAKAAALEYSGIFGPEHFYLELQDHGIAEQKLVNRQLVRMHEETGLPLVCTNDVHYTKAEDAEAHDVLLCIQTGKKVTDEDRMRYEGGQYYVKSQEEMAALFGYIPEALENTGRIAERCEVTIVFGERKLPAYDVPAGYDAWSYLNAMCREALPRLYPEVTEEIRQRLDYELETIRSMGFVDYFLIVWDYIKYARDHGIPVGPGRGSAAGSLVSYCLGITQLDPLKYNLLFERFLNPERVSMPDIDVDFCFERRQEVIDYVVRKYGKDRVVQIVTFGTMAARGVIRDVARALDLPYAEADKIAKMIPKEPGITLHQALEMNPELSRLYETDETVRALLDMAVKLEGLPRNTSMHAAGVVISGRPVNEYVPLGRAQDGSITTQYTMTTLEELGLLKMDFLGLRTLTVIRNAESLVNASRGPEAARFDIDKIDYDDPAVMAMLGRGKCEGVFQLESAGMKAFMKELKPRVFEDIIAGIALYRPGPMDFIPRYIAGKTHPESVTYDCPEMKPILETTYGCIVYQEQVMQIVRDLGGYSMGRSDLVRRAMSKKKASVMAKERQNFIFGNEAEGVPGCLARGISEDVASHIFDEMTDFARYAFNKSHAAAYAVLSMQTAWLKHYYPVEFMAALMTSVIDHPEKCAEYILHLKEVKIPLLPPSVNHGEGPFTTENGAIRCGLYAIKSIGRGVIDSLIAERQKGGPYRDLRDFLSRTCGTDLNKRAIENLIKAGALDDLGGTRKQMMQAYAMILDEAAREKKASMDGQISLFDMMAPQTRTQYQVRLPDVGEYSKESLLALEKEVLGVYLSGHPLEAYETIWRRGISALSTDFQPEETTGEPKVAAESRQIIGGMITGKTIKYTKNNKVMAFITVEDLVGSVEVLVFPKLYEQYGRLLEEDARVFIEGRVSAEDDKASKLILDKLTLFDDRPKELWIAFDNREAFAEGEARLRSLIDQNGTPGDDTVVVYLRNPRMMKRLAGVRVKVTAALTGTLAAAFGGDKVAVREKRVEK